MKKALAMASLFFISFFVFAQSFERSQYTEIDLFSYRVEENQARRDYTVKYKMVINFDLQSGTSVSFHDDIGENLILETNQRWNLNRGQVVTVFFSARKASVWLDEKLDYLETSTASSAKPWLPYVSNGRTGLHGWYLQDMGNGTYREVYFE